MRVAALLALLCAGAIPARAQSSRTAAIAASVVQPVQAATSSAIATATPAPPPGAPQAAFPTVWDVILKVTQGDLAGTLPYTFDEFAKLAKANPTIYGLLRGVGSAAALNLTVFIFDDAGWKNVAAVFGAGYQKFLEGQSGDLLNYHIVPRRIEPLPKAFLWERTLLGNTGGLSTVAEGQQIQIDATVKPATQASWDYAQNGFNAQARIIDKLPATNGIVYVIDQVVVPPFPPYEATKNATGLKKFNDVLTKTNSSSLVNGPTRATIFAPVDGAWDQYPTILTELTNAELQEVINHHVVPDAIVNSTQLVNGTWATPANNDPIYFYTVGSAIHVSDIATDAMIVSKDTLISNGLMHTVDKVLVPEKYRRRLLPTIAENIARINDGSIGTKDYKLGTLAALLKKIPSYSSALASSGNFTLFAPSDRAFFGLSPVDGLVTADQAPIVPEILKYHIVPEAIKAKDWSGNGSSYVAKTMMDNTGALGLTSLPDGQRIVIQKAASGSLAKRQTASDWLLVPYQWTVQHGSGAVASIVDTIECKNGYIHIIDNVLTAPATVTDTARALGYTAFVDAIVQLGRNGTINGLQKATVFVPTNEAFTAAASTLSGLTPNQLQTYLQHHIYNGLAFSTAVEGSSATSVKLLMADGTEATVSRTLGGNLTIDGATVVRTDVLTKNGVLHAVSKVLAPGSLPGPETVAPTASKTVAATASASNSAAQSTATSKPSSGERVAAGWLAVGAAAAAAVLAA